MKQKSFLTTKVTKTVIWLILFGVMIAGFVFIVLDETCTCHINKLIEGPKLPPSPNNLPMKATEFEDTSSEHEIDVVEI
jgi:hypothetical protein